MCLKILMLILSVFPLVVYGGEIIKIADPRIKAVAIQESHEPLIDLTDAAINPTDSKIRLMPDQQNVHAGFYHAPHSECFKMRAGLFKALKTMINHLPDDVGLYVYEAYRPMSIQKQYFDKVFNETKERNPTLKDEEIFQQTATMVSPVVDNVPPHCTGGAIDITLINLKTNEPLDMGKFGVLFGKNDVSETHSDKITDVQKKNRGMLLQAAEKAGLVNYPMEWWHYSLGDRYASYMLGKKYAIYGFANAE
jgi:zinc D-Ala-D-Ala dipeptidase